MIKIPFGFLRSPRSASFKSGLVPKASTVKRAFSTNCCSGVTFSLGCPLLFPLPMSLVFSDSVVVFFPSCGPRWRSRSAGNAGSTDAPCFSVVSAVNAGFGGMAITTTVSTMVRSENPTMNLRSCLVLLRIFAPPWISTDDGTLCTSQWTAWLLRFAQQGTATSPCSPVLPCRRRTQAGSLGHWRHIAVRYVPQRPHAPSLIVGSSLCHRPRQRLLQLLHLFLHLPRSRRRWPRQPRPSPRRGRRHLLP